MVDNWHVTSTQIQCDGVACIYQVKYYSLLQLFFWHLKDVCGFELHKVAAVSSFKFKKTLFCSKHAEFSHVILLLFSIFTALFETTFSVCLCLNTANLIIDTLVLLAGRITGILDNGLQLRYKFFFLIFRLASEVQV